MMPMDWLALLGGAALLTLILGLGWLGMQGGALLREQPCRVVCPRTDEPTDCSMVQDLRTGQWQRVTTCAAFADPRAVTCAQECRTHANLGYRLPQVLAS